MNGNSSCNSLISSSSSSSTSSPLPSCSSQNIHQVQCPRSSSSSASFQQFILTSTNLQKFDENQHLTTLSSLNYHFTEITGNHLSKLALGLKTILQYFLLQRPAIHIRKVSSRSNSSSGSTSSSGSCSDDSGDGQCSGHHENQKKRQRFDLEEDESAVYEIAVIKYRLLRNEIPLLTDAAHDIESTKYTLHGRSGNHHHPSSSSCSSSSSSMTNTRGQERIQIGPSLKRAPPGRGRRKTLSVINTPLPAVVLESLKKQKKSSNSDPNHLLLLSRPLKILFIDDSLVTLRLTAKRFQDAGFWIETISNGPEALTLLMNDETEFDIVLTDINMPIMSGAEVCPHLLLSHHLLVTTVCLSLCYLQVAIALRQYEENKKKCTGTVRRQFLIGTSCDTGREVAESAIAAGMDVFLAKPFTPSDLKLFVKPNLGGASPSRQLVA
jgi:CheY-like chemotaxis protein